MQMRGHVGQFHKVVEIFDSCVAPPFVKIADEGAAICRREYRIIATNNNTTLFIARMLGKLARCVVRDQFAAKSFGDTYTLTLYIRTSLLPDIQRFGVVTKFNANLLEYCFSIVFYDQQSLFTQHFVQWDFSCQVGWCFRWRAFDRGIIAV